MLGAYVRPFIPNALLQSLLIDGVWKGVQSVLVFLPQILLLFLFIGMLEDSGYLARAALIADRVMRTIGLNGKAFIPLLSAYACAVPAIMATRTIENKRDRIRDDPGDAVHDVLGAAADLHADHCGVYSESSHAGTLLRAAGLRDAFALPAGISGALATARLLKSSILKSSADAVHPGTAAIPLADADVRLGCGSTTGRASSSTRRARLLSA